jgi:hypothetical protein
MTANHNAGNFSVSGNVTRLEFFPQGDGIFPLIINKTGLNLEGLLLIDGQRVWVKVPRNGSAKLPRYDYEKIELVDEKVIYLHRERDSHQQSGKNQTIIRRS